MKLLPRILAVLLLLAPALSGWAGIGITPGLLGASKEDQLRQAKRDADISLHEKLEVGKRRYDQRVAYRGAIVAAMQNAMMERQTEVARTPILGASSAGRNPFDPTILLVVTGLALVVYWGSRQFQKA